MLSAVLTVHSLLRWVVLLAGLVAVGLGIAGWRGRSWQPVDRIAGRAFIGTLDLQLLIGLLLYVVLSPTVGSAMANIGEAMRDSMARFFLVEHPLGMVAAIALAHVGNVRIKKSADDAQRHRTAAIFFGLALLLILLSIPWPGMPAGRPLWPR
jgi:hypothetical protein